MKRENHLTDAAKTLDIDRSPGRMGKLKAWLLLVILSAILAIAGVVSWVRAQQADSIQYKTRKVEKGNLTVIVTATGTLKPINTVDVGSELSGIIKSVEANYNAFVKVGQVLTRLDTLKLEAQVKQSQAALGSAKGKVFQTEATVKETRNKLAQLRKLRELSGGKVPSQTDLDAAEAASDRALADDASARTAVSQAEATLEANLTDLSKAVIRSPINGVVLTRSVEPGQTVAAAYQAPTLFTLAEDLTQMELHVNVDEADIGKVRAGQNATFSVSAYPNRTFQAQITQVHYASTTSSGVVTYETVLKLDNSDLSLRPGMTATADITVRKLVNAVLVPEKALRFTPPTQEEEKSTVRLIDSLLPHPPRPQSKQREDMASDKQRQNVWTWKDGQLLAIPVTIGLTNGTLAEVVDGNIKPGMDVAVDLQEKKK